MYEARRQLLSIAVFFVVLVVGILLYATGIIDWTLVAPVVLVLFGVWMLALSIMRSSNSAKYERGSFSTLSLSLLLIGVGGAWYLFSINWLYSLVLILVVFAALAIGAALRHK
jgi:hypothetical protein